MERSTIIVAGGRGKRMGTAIPKQFLLLNGKPLLCWTIDAFHVFDGKMEIVLVLPEEQIPIWKSLCIGHGYLTPHQIVAGGAERYHSVRNGLAAVHGEGIVAVHDGVRPLVSTALIARCFDAAQEYGNATPVVPVKPSVRELTPSGSRSIDRNGFRLVQTPQCFRTEVLRKAFELPYDPSFTDEASLIERAGSIVHLVEGDEVNIKITDQVDMRIAEALLDRAPGTTA